MPSADKNVSDSFVMPLFSTKKALLTFDEYASRQGVSSGVIEQCAKLGIVQVRKHKNDRFVVDLPLSAYRREHSGSFAGSGSIDTIEHARKISKVVTGILKSSSQDAAEEIELKEVCLEKGDNFVPDNVPIIAEGDVEEALVNAAKAAAEAKRRAMAQVTEVIDETVDIIENQQKLSEQTSSLGRIFQSQIVDTPVIELQSQGSETMQAKVESAIPDLKLFADEERTSRTYVEMKSSFVKLKVSFMRRMVEFAATVQLWRVAAVVMAVGMVFGIGAYMWSSMEMKAQKARLETAYASIQALSEEYDRASQKASAYQVDLLSSRFESEKTKRLLATQEAEMRKIEDKFQKANKDIQALEKYNSETLKSLNDQIKNIATQLPSAK